MSGHSKWAKIKHKKGANDAKRGNLFTKLAKAITMAAAEGGGDPGMNFSLRLAMDKAKLANMPLTNIDRAVKKGTGEDGKTSIQKIIYEGIGPAGSSFIVECSTDNVNRTIADMRQAFEKHGGTIGKTGSTAWKFEEKGEIIVKPEKLKKSEQFGKQDVYLPVGMDEFEMELMEIEGVEDIEKDDEDMIFLVFTSKMDFINVHKELISKGINIVSAELTYIPKETFDVVGEKLESAQNLVEELEELDDVDNVFVDFETN